MAEATLRLYGPLNDFVAAARRHTTFTAAFDDAPSIKDLIERVGVPHPEIDLLVVNDESAAFDRRVADGDRIAVFPRFHAIDVGTVTQVRPAALPSPRFVLDGHLGRLARRLRLVGLDTEYRPDAPDEALARAAASGRILLTRDVGLLKRRAVAHGRFIRHTEASAQLREVLERFGPLPLAPLTRCVRCNGVVEPVAKAVVEPALPPRTRAGYREFLRCTTCGRVYWKGAHWPRIARILDGALGGAAGSDTARFPGGRPVG